MLTTREPISFVNEGQKLIGVLHRPAAANQDKIPAVVLFHGFTGTKVERHRIFVKTSEALAREGIAALRFDFRGSGDSEGDFEDMTLQGEISDARVSLDYVSGVPGIDGNNIGILGLSMGGAVAASVSDDPRVKSVVMWSAVADLESAFMDVARSGMLQGTSGIGGTESPGRSNVRKEELGGVCKGQIAAFEIPHRVDVKGNVVGREFILTLTDVRPLETVRRCKAPVLVIHGDQDESVPVVHSAMYERAIKEAGGTVEVYIVPGADHTYNSAVWEADVISKTVEWFKRSLLR
ncbi:MAG: alpha/beta hydrolase [Clostridia bacterium]